MNLTLNSPTKQLARQLNDLQWQLATAESCTAGGIAYHLTEQAGASHWFAGGVVAYSNEVKRDILGVSEQVLSKEGAVSAAVVTQMARGVLTQMHAHCSVAVSGIAGPGGGTGEKPVGTVWIAWAWQAVANDPIHVRTHRVYCLGERASIRLQSIALAIEGLNTLCAHMTMNQAIPEYLLPPWDKLDANS